MDILTTSELTAPIAKDNGPLNEPNQAFMTNNCAAKVSNLDSNDIEIDADKDEKGRNFDEFALFVRDNSPQLLNLVMSNTMTLRKMVF